MGFLFLLCVLVVWVFFRAWFFRFLSFPSLFLVPLFWYFFYILFMAMVWGVGRGLHSCACGVVELHTYIARWVSL
ncbi:hypothetical protein DFP73DRAFT_546863 [Morchella snyderi]|nr:hypothetical protein DFP73DRAFT_546863 [Morchella snyderi]